MNNTLNQLNSELDHLKSRLKLAQAQGFISKIEALETIIELIDCHLCTEYYRCEGCRKYTTKNELCEECKDYQETVEGAYQDWRSR
jgi:hypothetical protein